MSEITNPRTPILEAAMRCVDTTPLSSPGVNKDVNNMDAKYGPSILSAGAMTPPPSTQLPKPVAKSAQAKSASRRENPLASPPPTLRTGPPITSVGLFGEIPSIDSVQNMNEERLRGLVTELLPALGEARVTAAHSKLQHSLLSIETEESAKRAEVEHEATRREVQVLQEGSPVQRHNFSPRSPQAAMQRNLHLALAHCRDLQQENSVLEKRLRSSKKIIAHLDGQNADLKENVQLLRQRIKENRDHLNEMQSSGAMSIKGTPAIEYSTPLHKGTPRTPATTGRPTRDVASHPVGSQDPFDTLLFAGQVLNGEASSVPSTPIQPQPRKLQPNHLRSAHSLSSLPNTPNRSRPVTADNSLITSVERHIPNPRASCSAPNANLTYEEEHHAREDRDSTISASDIEDESYQDEDIPGSQASQMATSMLRRSLGSQKESDAVPGQPLESSKIVQGKLFGQVKKPGVARTEPSLKRGGDINSYDEVVRSTKKARMADSGLERVGLGIS
ncbi:hypothetical protein MMC28_000601 [Mycoblastus sanguinarius]|nr:hypothetical protein [Mycoblastus sanguinarius]